MAGGTGRPGAGHGDVVLGAGLGPLWHGREPVVVLAQILVAAAGPVLLLLSLPAGLDMARWSVRYGCGGSARSLGSPIEPEEKQVDVWLSSSTFRGGV